MSTAISEECLRFLGELGCAKAGIQILDVWNNQKGIIRVDNKSVNELKSALILIKEIDGKNVIIKTKGVSGILKKAKEKL